MNEKISCKCPFCKSTALLNNVAKITPLKKFAQFSFVLVANYI
ncbi:uncharacterized protein METZ01_LOCUS486242 [marine metagenome]|uniref:Uncharacterized protein n=1 Tax=marine metagenome TaxID=408172 RepID=A0A383CP38_9ZZZZ